MTERIPPQDQDAEAGALGAMLLDAMRMVPIAMGKIGPESFYSPAHAKICAAIYELAVTKHFLGIDTLTVGAKLRETDELEKIGGMIELDRLIDNTPTAEHGEYYVDIVADKAIARSMIATVRDVENEAYRAESAEKLLASLPDRFAGLIRPSAEEKTNKELMDDSLARWRRAAEEDEPAIGLPTPWPDLTKPLCGLEPGLTILAARPSQGKTTMEDQIRVDLAGEGIPVGCITLDSSKQDLLDRALSRKAGVSLPKLKYGWAGGANFGQIEDARDILAKYPMYINDQARDIRHICSLGRQWKLKYDIQLLTVDFLQLIEAAEVGRMGWDAKIVVTLASKRLKALGFELGIPVLALSQLNRNIERDTRETRGGKKSVSIRIPQLSDLRDSGSIEQDAEKVIFLYKDLKRAKEMEEESPGATKKLRPMWAEIMKNKNGETGSVPLWLRANYFRFDTADEDFTEPGSTGIDTDPDVEIEEDNSTESLFGDQG
ncbi:MAG: replicative DNA helicase [Planctomycetota bacterium]|jgi:replicative DNA helicase